jgi:extracellular elastinolytic metalloproteinase
MSSYAYKPIDLTQRDCCFSYGFDEVSGNFQQHNFGRGGKEGDAVLANAQDGSGYNNANFMTPPDGQNGRCRMYLWNTANPYRDGDLEAGIVIHELSHGLSIRLTGGPANSGCLGWGESGGMGEGWGGEYHLARVGELADTHPLRRFPGYRHTQQRPLL